MNFLNELLHHRYTKNVPSSTNQCHNNWKQLKCQSKVELGGGGSTDINGGYVKGTQKPTPRVTSDEAVLDYNSKSDRDKHCTTFWMH